MIKTVELKAKYLDLKQKAADLKKQQDQGENHYGYRDAENLMSAAHKIQDAISIIELVNEG